MKKYVSVTILAIILLAGCATGGHRAAIPELVSLDEALAGAVADFASRVQGNTEIAIAKLDSSMSDVSDFISEELAGHLAAGGQFILLERGAGLSALSDEHMFQMSGFVSDQSAVGLGHYLGARVVITGSFSRFATFSQLRLRAIDVRSAQVLSVYSSRIRPDDAILAAIMQPMERPLPDIRENALAHLNRGEDLLREGRLEEAIREFDQALAINGDLAEAYFNRGCAHLALSNFERAIEDFNSALRLKPDYYEALIARGFTYISLGDSDRAIEDLNAAAIMKPDDFRAFGARAIVYLGLGDTDRALEDFNTALRIDPENNEIWAFRGVVYLNMGDHERAIEDLNAALRINPNSPQALNTRGAVYADMGDFENAARDVLSALIAQPYFDNAWQNLRNWFNNRLFGGWYMNFALEDLTGRLNENPNDHRVLFTRGIVHHQMRDFERAIEDFTAALRIQPDFQEALLDRGDAYERTGNYNRAIEDYGAVININPDNDFAYFRRGRLYSMDLNDYERAIADFSAALRITPYDATLLYSRANAYHRTGNLDSAIADWEEMGRISPDWYNIYDLGGHILNSWREERGW